MSHELVVALLNTALQTVPPGSHRQSGLGVVVRGLEAEVLTRPDAVAVVAAQKADGGGWFLAFATAGAVGIRLGGFCCSGGSGFEEFLALVVAGTAAVGVVLCCYAGGPVLAVVLCGSDEADLVLIVEGVGVEVVVGFQGEEGGVEESVYAAEAKAVLVGETAEYHFPGFLWEDTVDC